MISVWVSEQRYKIETHTRMMDVSLAPLYYGLLVIFSIFFYNVAEEGSLIEEGQKLYRLLSEKKDIIRENIVETFQPETVVKEEISPLSSLPFFEYLKKNSYLYNKILFIIDTLKKGASEYLEGHPEVAEQAAKIWNSIRDYSELVYSTCEKKFLYIVNQEPIKTYLSEYVKIHDIYITPYVEKTSDKVSGAIVKVIDLIKRQTSEDIQNDEIVYTFLVTVVGVFILKASFTRILKCFAKDAFQMNRSVSEMYKQQLVKDMIKDSEKHSDVYLEIKEDTLTDYNMTVDDIEEMEREYGIQNASNRRQQQQNQEQQLSKASNRTRSQEESSASCSSEFCLEAESESQSAASSGIKIESEPEEKGRQRPEEISYIDEITTEGRAEKEVEVDEAEEVRSFPVSPCVTTKSSKTFKSDSTDRSDSTESSIANTMYTTTSINTVNTSNNAGTKLVYIASSSVVYGEGNTLLKESLPGMSSGPVSGVTRAYDDNVLTAPASSSSGEDSLCESVRSLLV